MPKIIDSLRDNAIREARRVLTAPGYQTFTMRQIAAACGVAAGTLYNYFPSKEYLVGCVVLEDWQAALEVMDALMRRAATPDQGLEELYNSMRRFEETHQYLATFDIRDGKDGFAYDDRHLLLRRQLEVLLQTLLSRFGADPGEDVTVFLAECVLSFSTKKYPYSQIRQAFNKLLKGVNP